MGVGQLVVCLRCSDSVDKVDSGGLDVSLSFITWFEFSDLKAEDPSLSTIAHIIEITLSITSALEPPSPNSVLYL